MAVDPHIRPLATGLRLRSYTLVQRIGVGSDGEVWAATDPQGQVVALKARPRSRSAAEPRIFQEFERLRTLRIPNVVRVLTVDADQGYVFFTMELARGQPLDAWVQAGTDLGERVRRAAASGAGVARALAGIHRLRLAHRDIKPSNVHVDNDDTVTVLDFGTSRFGAGVEDEDGLVGTVHYMAPEQRIGLPQDGRVDLYALGVTLHEALSGVPARSWAPGRPRSSLCLLGAAVPLAMAALIDRMLALDPAVRPPAEEAQDVLERVASGRSLPPAPWPSPSGYFGDASPLLEGSAVVVGTPGSGRRRAVTEARWLWYGRGYRSVAGRCAPDEPWSALSEILAELLGPLHPQEQAALLGDSDALLSGVWPGLALAVGSVPVAQPEPLEVGRAVADLLTRLSPIAVALWDLDAADPGVARALPVLVHRVGPLVRIWATARRPGFGLRTFPPPRWCAEAEAAVLPELLPPGASLPPRPAATALQGVARAWRALARARGEPGPQDPPPQGAAALAVLDAPFPRGVAEQLCPDLRELLSRGHLRPWAPDDGEETRTRPRSREDLAFADAGTRALALAAEPDLPARCAAAATAWRQAVDQPERIRAAAALDARTGRPSDALLRAAVREELARGRTVELDRWLRLHALYHPRGADSDDFELAYARLLVDLELRPASVIPARLAALEERARDPWEAGLASYLVVVREARRGDRAVAVQLGRSQADALAQDHPGLAADLIREVSLANLARGEVLTAVREARRALALAREASARSARGPAPLSRSEGTATTTLSAALLYAHRIRESVELCEEGAARCREDGLHRGEGALLANRGIGLLYLGQREAAEAALARCREVQPRHRDPVVLANLAVTQARLAVERGDLAAGRVLVAEGLTAAEAAGDPHLVGEAWCIVLESALHTADLAEAQRALSAYGGEGIGSPWDHWPAVLARWRWLIGDLDGALAATDEPREGHGELCIRAERCRLLLVAGRYEQSAHESRALADAAESIDHLELARFARLVAGATLGVPDGEYGPLVMDTRTSRWVHLYLGALHLDAIRRRLRGENVDSLLRQLRARSRDLGHRLYEALARSEGW